MFGNSAVRLGLILAFNIMAVTAAEAQGKDSSKTAPAAPAVGDTTDTYVTPDGYGLGRIVSGALENVTQRARTALIKLKVVEDAGRSASGGDVREIRGKAKDNLDVVVTLRRQAAASTRVEVTARRGLAEYDQAFARKVLDAISKT
jgi:hypothetical protein